MLDGIKVDKVIFIDIETVSQKPGMHELDQNWQKLWEKKSSTLHLENSPEETYDRAGIYAEFGKVICISVGLVRKEKEDTYTIRLKSYFGNDEKQLLQDFSTLLDTHFNSSDYLLCAHNGKEFDFPFLARRMLVNRIKLPYLLDIAGRKPWEVQHLDTLQLWKFGDYKHYTSLELLCQLFNIPSPKENMHGSDVRKVYWEENNLEKIVDYCQNDTLAVAQLLLAYKGLPAIEAKNVSVSK